MTELESLTRNLENNSSVDAIFLTGSHGLDTYSSSSDIDLVIILNENPLNIRSVYELIDGVFSDIFFFTKADLETLLGSTTVSANTPLEQGILLSWVRNAKIIFDRSGTLTKLHASAPWITQEIPDHEKVDILQRVSYNLFQNTRYFLSNDPVYHEALNIRLLYSVVECISAFLTLRDRPWRGEKDAIVYLKETGASLYRDFLSFQTATSLDEKMTCYEAMAQKVPPLGTELFDYTTSIPLTKGPTTQEQLDSLRTYWEKLAGSHH
jgi:hypothetical protein